MFPSISRLFLCWMGGPKSVAKLVGGMAEFSSSGSVLGCPLTFVKFLEALHEKASLSSIALLCRFDKRRMLSPITEKFSSS